jgi:hypothetical protein
MESWAIQAPSQPPAEGDENDDNNQEARQKALDYDCLKAALDSILESFRREIASLQHHNASLENERRNSGWFNDVVDFIVYSGRNDGGDPFSTQIRFNNQRISTLNHIMETTGAQAQALASQILREQDPTDQLTMSAELLNLINILRRIKGVPELNAFCKADLESYRSRKTTLFLSDEQSALHKEAIDVSKDVTVAVITSIGGVFGMAGGSTKAGSIALSRVLSYALIGCLDGAASQYTDMLLDDMKDKNGNSLTEEQILEELAESCGLGGLLGGGPGVAKKLLQELGGLRWVRSVRDAIRKKRGIDVPQVQTPANP